MCSPGAVASLDAHAGVRVASEEPFAARKPSGGSF
jgi:hypothetical protein